MKPLDIGMVIEPFGTISAVAFLSGERHYFLENRYGVVSMMPADVVERMSVDSKPTACSIQQLADAWDRITTQLEYDDMLSCDPDDQDQSGEV